MSMQTMVFGSASRRSEKWRVYRIRTQNSVYELEVEAEGGTAGRRCVVLTCVEPKERAGQNYEDSSPQLDAQSLFALSPMDWMGKRLAVGTARTSEIQSVDFISSRAEPSTAARIQLQQLERSRGDAAVRHSPRTEEHRVESESRPGWAPFPAGHVEMAEAAASLLKCVCHRHDLASALENDEHLQQRLKLAFAECRLMLEALLRR